MESTEAFTIVSKDL